MKSPQSTFIWLLLSVWLLSIAITVVADDEDKWRKDLQKDYGKVLDEKNEDKRIGRHRDLVGKWQKKGYLAELIQLYETDTESKSEDATLQYGLGYAYIIQGGEEALEKAAQKFEQAVSLSPTLWIAHFSLGSAYHELQRLELARQEIEKCLELNPKYYPAHYRRGEIYLEQGELETALASFQAAMEINKKWEYPHYGLGLVYFEQGNDSLAREAFEEAINREKKFALPRYKLGQVLAKERFFEDALAEYATASKYQPYTAEVLYELGVIFAEEGEQAGATQIYQRAITIDPTYAPAHIQLGEIYYAAEQHDLAIEHYKQAIESDPTLKNYFIEQLAPYHAGLMGIDEAKSLLDRALAVNPDDPQAHFYSAQVEADMGNLAEAVQHYEKTMALIEQDPSYLDIELPLCRFLDAYMFLGDIYYQQGNNEKAATTFRQAIALDATLERHFFDLGQAAFEAELFDQAVDAFKKFLLIFPANIEAMYLLGRNYEALTDLENALQFYARTIELDANHKDAMMRSAQIYRGKNEPRNALAMLTRLIAIDPQNVEAHYLSGLSHLELNEADGALGAFVETTRLDQNHVDAHYRAALLYEQKGDIDNAVDRYETTIRLDGSNAAPFLRVGTIYLQRGDKDSVVRVYEPGLALEPDHPQAQYDLATIFEERVENEKAIKHFGLANHHDGSHFDWHFRYARLLDRHVATLEDYDQYAAMAVEEYSNTIANKNDYAPAYFYRALITRRYKQIGDTLYRYSQIAEDFKQVITLEPRNVDAHYHLGTTYLDLDQRREAQKIFEKTLKLDPKYKGVHLQLGLIAEWEQKFKEAIKHFEAEIAIDPKSARAYQRVGDLYNNYALNFGRAKETLEKALELEPNHVATRLNLGSTFFNLDQLGAATEQFETVLQLDPKELTANFNLALMYEYTGKKQQAIDRWKKFLELNPPAEWKAEAETHLRQLQP